MAQDDQPAGLGKRDLARAGIGAGLAAFFGRFTPPVLAEETRSGVPALSSAARNYIAAGKALADALKIPETKSQISTQLREYYSKGNYAAAFELLQQELPRISSEIHTALPDIIEKWKILNREKSGFDEIERHMERIGELDALFNENIESLDFNMKSSSPASAKAWKAYKDALTDEQKTLMAIYSAAKRLKNFLRWRTIFL